MRLIIKAVLLTLIIGLTTTNIVNAQADAWIVGTWQLSHDPDGDSKDKLVFNANKTFTNIASNGQKFNGKYEMMNGRVKVSLEKQGRPFMSFFLGYEKNKSGLHFYSEKTKKTSIYKKN